jgi:ribonuclease Z
MPSLLNPTLVNDRFGDAALYIDIRRERRAILIDLGNIENLPREAIARIKHVCVSHTHLDHFCGFDRFLRVLLNRETTVNLYGPERFIDQVEHKLRAYTWNLLDEHVLDLAFIVTEITPSGATRHARFRLKSGFSREVLGLGRAAAGVIMSDPSLRITTAYLDHRIPCLAFAIEEHAHVNVFSSGLKELGLKAGPWVSSLKEAVLRDKADNHPIAIHSGIELPLRELRHVVSITPGQKIAYVTDIAGSAANREAVARLAHGADILFIEAAFAKDDAALAADRAHLTTAAAGQIARAAQVRRVEPFHFSHRYKRQSKRMMNEVTEAFRRKASER